MSKILLSDSTANICLELEPEPFLSDASAYVDCIKIWEAANYFELDLMKRECENRLTKLLREEAVRCQQAIPSEKQMVGFISGVKYVYEREIKPLKQKFLDFVADTFYWAIPEMTSLNVYTTVPNYFADIFREVPDDWKDKLGLSKPTQDDKRKEPTFIPPTCCECGKDPFKMDSHYAKLGRVCGYNIGICFHCWLSSGSPTQTIFP